MKDKYHIMVADDEPAVREILRNLILALGNEYVVYAAADSFEALRMLETLPLDLALVDIFMPGLDGFGLLKEARSKYPRVMMVIITGKPSYDNVLESLRLGAADFLAKPILLPDLNKILDKLKDHKSRFLEGTITPGAEIRSEMASLPQDLAEKIPGQNFIFSLSEQLETIQRVRDLYPFLTTMAQTLTGGAQVACYLYDQERGRFQLVSRTDEALATAEPQTGDAPAAGEDNPVTFGAAPPQQEILSPAFLSLPLKLRGNLLGVLQVFGHPDQSFDSDLKHRLNILVDRTLLTLENLTLHESVFYNIYDTLTALINSLEARDPYSRQHSVRVTHVAVHFAEALGLATELVDSLRLAGALHDIGKIGIPDAILFKPTFLSAQEMAIIRQHSVIGENIVAPLNLLPRERALILHHHERWDGQGYPMGLKGEDIPYLSRIIALADSYDAITTDRPYRQRRTHEEALKEIAAHAGSQFDPELAARFIKIMGQPFIVRKIRQANVDLGAGQSFLSQQQFQALKKNLSQKLFFLNGHKKNPRISSSQ